MEQGRSEEILKQLQDQRQPALPRRVKLQADCQMVATHNHNQPPPSQKCPRCDSSNTKFCYYNNYSLSQPRYFCKACRRYWTQGGTLRNVPVGGGCRKSKRSKPSSSSTSGSAEVARIQSLSSPALSSQNLTGMINSGQSLRNLPPINVPTVGNNSFYTGGAFLSTLAAMQSLPTGVNQVAGVNFGGGSHFGANMALLHGINIPSLKPQAPQQFQAQNEFYPSQQSLIPQRPLNSWTQSFINRGAASSSAGSSSYWGGANVGNTTDGSGDQAAAGSSFYPNQWSNNHPRFDPSL